MYRWTFSGTLCLKTSICTRPTNFHVWKPRGCRCSFRLLMMVGVSPETCLASYKYGIIQFWYSVASCWISSLWIVLWCTDPRTSNRLLPSSCRWSQQVSPKILYVYSYQSTRHQITEDSIIYYYCHDKTITEVVTYAARETKLNGRIHTQPVPYPQARMLVSSQISNKPIGALLYNAKSMALLGNIYKTSTPVLISHDMH